MLRARIITGAILGVAITISLLLLPTAATAVVFAALWLMGAWEWGALARLTGSARLIYVGLLAAAMLAAFLTEPARWLGGALGAAALWWMIALVAVLTYPRSFRPAAVAVIGVVVLVPSWAVLIAMHGTGRLGHALALTVLVIVWAADVGAFMVGRRLGRVKLAPKVSPGKTWEGVTGGLAAAAIAAWAAAVLLGLPVATMIALGIATALVSVVGDLTVSMFKRNVGLKDSGTLLPGHGGVMDRIDSLTAAIPIFAIGLHFAGLLAV